MNMRRLTVALALASACIFVASCSRDNQNTSSTPLPVTVDALYDLPLSPAEINAAMGATGITVNGTDTDMVDESANIPDKDCRFIDPAEASVYAGSGWTAVRSQHLREPGRGFDHEVWQAVVSYRSASDAARSTASAQRGWPACSNRQFHYILPGKPDVVFTMGPIANTNGTLSITRGGSEGWACQHALTVSNNIAIDVAACSASPADAGVNIAHQIAAKVAKL
jgi:hypothetical protein